MPVDGQTASPTLTIFNSVIRRLSRTYFLKFSSIAQFLRQLSCPGSMDRRSDGGTVRYCLFCVTYIGIS